jgi:predicted DNA-binding transcriptional regulator AlpA
MAKAKTNPVPCVYWPRDIEQRYDISAPTRWRWEKNGRLPPRDFFLAGRADGWHRATIESAEHVRDAGVPSQVVAAGMGNPKRNQVAT